MSRIPEGKEKVIKTHTSGGVTYEVRRQTFISYPSLHHERGNVGGKKSNVYLVRSFNTRTGKEYNYRYVKYRFAMEWFKDREAS